MLYYRSLRTVPTPLRMSNIFGRAYWSTITVTHDYKHVLYVLLILNRVNNVPRDI
jgi:hypothetical protein